MVVGTDATVYEPLYPAALTPATTIVEPLGMPCAPLVVSVTVLPDGIWPWLARRLRLEEKRS